MTTESTLIKTRRRGLSGFDSVVLFVTLAAVASPFAARWMEVQASSAQVAVRGDVAPLTIADLQVDAAEAAFFEGLEQPKPTISDDVLDLALASPPEPEPEPVTYLAPPRPPVTYVAPVRVAQAVLDAAAFEDDLDALEAPEPVAEASEPVQPATEPEVVAEPKTEPSTDVASAPEPETEPQPEAEDELVKTDPPVEPKLLRVIMTAPPTMTPVPSKHPRIAERADVRVASLNGPDQTQSDADINLPVDVTPPLPQGPISTVIDEVPLPPPGGSEPLAIETLVAMAAPRVQETPALPADTAPQPAPQVTKPEPVVDAKPLAADSVVKAAPPVTPTTPKAPVIKNGPRIALVITAAGLNANVTRFAIEALPAGVTLAFAPVKAEASALADEAKEDGHTILVEIPMEPINKRRDPGPLTLRAADPVAANLNRLDKALARIPAAEGASSYLGARFNAVEGAAAPIVAALAKRDLFFFENQPTARSTFERLSAKSDLPYAKGVAVIDRDKSAASIRAQLAALEARARKRGSAVGVGTALRGTISTVALWAKEAEKRGVQFVPIIQVGR